MDLVPPMPPLGLGFLASFLLLRGHRVKILDNFIYGSNYPHEKFFFHRNLLKALKSFQPDFVGVYVDSVSFQNALRLIALIKQNSFCRIICGGPHSSVMPESLPEEVDFVVRGEGEEAILSIVEGKINQRLVSASRIEDLDILPMPAWQLYSLKRYALREEMYFKQGPVFNLNTSRGCPFACAFCSVPGVWGGLYRAFSAGRIIEEIEFLIKNYNAKGIYFREDNFTADKERVHRFCDGLLSRGIKIPWACETRVDTVDRNLMAKMKRAGCVGFYVGAESGSQRVLDALNKNITVGQIEDFFASCHSLGIITKASFIVGSPFEQEDDRQKTELLIKRIKPDYVSRVVFLGIPRSRLYNYILENRLYYYKDENGFLYPYGYREFTYRYYGRRAKRFIP